MVGYIRNLTELAREGGTIRATCRECQRVSLFAPFELATYFALKGLNERWPAFAMHLRCSECGARNPQVTWQTGDPPTPEPQPPTPRLVRSNAPKGGAVVPLRRRA